MIKCDYCLNEFEEDILKDYENDDKWICGDCKQKRFIEKNDLIKDKYTTFENALIVNNYPYGFLKTQIKFYIESNKNGDRFLTCTLNPKTNKWNTPKKSTYSAIMVLIKEKETGHIKHAVLNFTTNENEIKRFIDFIGDYTLNEFQIKQIKTLKAYSKVYKNVIFKCEDTTNRTEEETQKAEEEQKKIKETINKNISLEYSKNTPIREF
jgi:hypothetical protein